MILNTEGFVVNYRKGIKTQRNNTCLLFFENMSSHREASKLIGRKVTWQSKDRSILGKIVALHGKKGLVRARFRKGLPGEAIGTSIKLTG